MTVMAGVVWIGGVMAVCASTQAARTRPGAEVAGRVTVVAGASADPAVVVTGRDVAGYFREVCPTTEALAISDAGWLGSIRRHNLVLVGGAADKNKLLAEAIAETDLDYIEAFTPAPTTDMTVTQAREVWPDKVLWLNFPCDVHLRPGAEVAAVAMDLVDQATTPEGLLIGITDDVPENRWRQSFTAIMDGLEQHAREHSDLYR